MSIKGIGITDGYKIAEQSLQVIYRLVKSADNKDADGILVACTNFPVSQMIKQLETLHSKLVVTANQATLWSALRKLGISESIEGYGSLLMNTNRCGT